MGYLFLTTARILIVDDEPANVRLLEIILKQAGFNNICSSTDAREVSTLYESFQPDALLLDLKMPWLSGFDVMEQILAMPTSNGCAPILVMTADASPEIRQRALTSGAKDFLTKPFDATEILLRLNNLLEVRFQHLVLEEKVRERTRDIKAALQESNEKTRLLGEEAFLLQTTLTGCVGILTEILSLEDSAAHSLSLTLRDYAMGCANALEFDDLWRLELAVMLSRIGQVAVPPDIKLKANEGKLLLKQEQILLDSVPEIGRNLLVRIPRLESVAMIVLYQNKCFDGTGFPEDNLKGENIPKESRLLKILGDLVTLEMKRTSRQTAFRTMAARSGWYDPVLFEEVQAYLTTSEGINLHHVTVFNAGTADVQATERAIKRAKSVAYVPKSQTNPVAPDSVPSRTAMLIRDLEVGNVLAENVIYMDGTLVIAANSIITNAVLERLLSWSKVKPIKQPVYIMPTQPRPMIVRCTSGAV